MPTRGMQCPSCGDERAFDTPPCAEHGVECAELACRDCGAALTVSSVELVLLPRPRRAALGAAA
jgi:hypothetical protein